MVDIQEVELIALPENKISKVEFPFRFYSHILDVHLGLHYCATPFIHLFIFNWSIIALQSCVSFDCTMK